MKNFFYEIDHFHPNFDESVPNRSRGGGGGPVGGWDCPVKADFGQSNFGQSHLGQSIFGQSIFRVVFVVLFVFLLVYVVVCCVCCCVVGGCCCRLLLWLLLSFVWLFGPPCAGHPSAGPPLPKEREKGRKWGAGDGKKKSAKFWAPHPLGLHLRGSTFFWVLAPPWGPTNTPDPKTDWPKLDWPKLDWPKFGLAKLGPAKTTMAKNGIGQSRSPGDCPNPQQPQHTQHITTATTPTTPTTNKQPQQHTTLAKYGFFSIIIFCDDTAERKKGHHHGNLTSRCGKTRLPDHVICRWCRTTCPHATTPLEERYGKRTCGGASKNRTPPKEPRLFGSGPHDFWFAAHLSLGQQA